MNGRVRDRMEAQPHTIRDDQPVVAAARRMRQAQTGSLVVIDAENRVCGIVTTGDIALRVVAEAQDPTRTPVGSICSQEIAFARPDEDVREVYARMRARNLRRLPVVERGRAIGLLRLCDDQAERVIELERPRAAVRPPS